MNAEELFYGPVVITKGRHKGRIGYYDDDDRFAIVYFGSFFLADTWWMVRYSSMRQANTDDLLARNEVISGMLGISALKKVPLRKKHDLLLEKNYIESVLNANYLDARFGTAEDFEGVSVFLSHSSKDKSFVRQLAVDLVQMGIKPWLDEWEIRAGESITEKVSSALKNCHCTIVVLSGSSTSSKWVEREWQSKYWDEIQSGSHPVIPAILESCEIPQLLKGKKYVDFRIDYSDALEELFLAIPKSSSL